MADFIGELLVKVRIDNKEANEGINRTSKLARELATKLGASFDKLTTSINKFGLEVLDSSDDVAKANEKVNATNRKRGKILGQVTKEGTTNIKKTITNLDKLKNKSKETAASLTKFGKKASSIGKSLTTNLTLPILAIGGAMVKFAIDAEETRAKFETAFRGIEDKADETAANLKKNFGLSTQESEKLLGNTGDLLKGFGATADEALALSNEIQELAVDLASYNNVVGGASKASETLTKAVLGNREGLISLGIKINDVDVKQRLIEKGQTGLIGQAKLLARAYATMEIALEQTGDAQGDFARTSDSTANQLRQLKSDALDLAVEFGNQLLPTVNGIVKSIREGVATFSNFSDETKKTILIVGGLVATIGPVVSLVGAVTTAVGGLSTAFAFLAANPIVAVIAAVTALTVGMIAMRKSADNAIQDEVIEKFGELAESSGIAARELRQLDANLSVLDIDAAFDATTTLGKIQELAEGFGTTEDIIIDIALASKEVSSELKKEIFLLKASKEERKLILDSSSELATLSSNRISTEEGLVLLAQDQAEAAEAELEAEQEIETLRAKEEARRKGVAAARLAAEKEYSDEVTVVNNLRNLGFLNELEANERLLSANQQLIESLADIGYNGLRDDIGDKTIVETIARVKELTEANKELNKPLKDQEKLIKDIRFIDKRSAEERLADNNFLIKSLTNNYLGFSDTLLTTNEEITKAVKDQQKAQLDGFVETFNSIVGLASSFKNNIVSIFNEISNNQKIALDNRQQEEEKAITDDIQARRDAISTQIQDVEELNNQLAELDEQASNISDASVLASLDIEKGALLAELEAQKELKESIRYLDEEEKNSKVKLAKEIEEAKREIARKDAIINKATSIFDIAVNTASAVVQALPNIPLSIAIGALGAVQAGIVTARPLPALAEGGFFSGPALIGEAGREFAFPLDGPQGQNAMGLMADKLLNAMGNLQPNSSSTNITQNNNTLFELGNKDKIDKAAKVLLPALEEEAKRRGFSLNGS